MKINVRIQTNCQIISLLLLLSVKVFIRIHNHQFNYVGKVFISVSLTKSTYKQIIKLLTNLVPQIQDRFHKTTNLGNNRYSSSDLQDDF